MNIREELLTAFDSMDDAAQLYTLGIAKGQVARHPRPAAKPVLSLVISDFDSRHLLREAPSFQNVKLTARSRAPKKVK